MFDFVIPMADATAATRTVAIPYKGIAIALVGAAAVYLIAKAAQSGSRNLTSQHRSEMIDDIIDIVAKDVKDKVSLRKELESALWSNGELSTVPLSDIVRIECTYIKLSNKQYERKLTILRKKDAKTATATSVTRNFDWEYLPDEVRKQMITSKQEKVVVLIYPVGKEK